MNNKVLVLIAAILLWIIVSYFMLKPTVVVAPALDIASNNSSFLSSLTTGKNISSLSSEIFSSATQNKVVANWDNISVNYIWKFQDWKIFDTSLENIAKQSGLYNPARPYSPLSFKVWNWDMIKGFDEAVVGMKIWETKTITLPPEKAYWNSNPDLIKSLPLTQFQQAGLNPKLWDEIAVWAGSSCKIISVDEKEAKMDCNSPMAWKTLVFDITLVSIN